MMESNRILNYIKEVLVNMPTDWLNLTTHRLDIYDESKAKTQFLDQLENLYSSNTYTSDVLAELPTAYYYIRLGHPLSCLLEWGIAKSNNIDVKNVISFSSQTTPILAVLRKNLLENKNTQILYTNKLPDAFDSETIQKVYGYTFETKKIDANHEVSPFDGSIILVTEKENISAFELSSSVDFFININPKLGSILLVNGEKNEKYTSEIPVSYTHLTLPTKA